MLVFPITKYEKGFFTHTFYSRTTIENKPYDLRFKIDYLNHTVTVEDVETLNQRIKNINSKSPLIFMLKNINIIFSTHFAT